MRVGLDGFDAVCEPLGQCYPWAYRYLMDNPDAVLVHGTLPRNKVMGIRRAYGHGWIEHDGYVKDWQTMEAQPPYGPVPAFRKTGWPLDVFYRMFQPINMRRYTHEEAMHTVLRSRGGAKEGGPHFGPWHGRGSRGGRSR